MSRNVFITGASGFLGRNLIAEFGRVYQDANLYCLARSDEAEQSIRSRLQWLPEDRTHMVRGDITLPYLGLDQQQAYQLMSGMNDVWHLAASTSFNEKQRDEIRKINIEGTQHVLDTIQSASLDHFFYVSTAYIAGRTEGVIQEDAMPGKNGFKNSYEESKYDSEANIRSIGLPLTVLRPSILIGHSKTGKSEGERRMVYGYIAGLYHAIAESGQFGAEPEFWEQWHKREQTPRNEWPLVPCRLRGYPPSTKNLVAIDDAVEVILRIAESGNVTGKTYHIVNPHNTTYGEIIEGMSKALRVNGLKPAGDLTEVNPDNPIELTAHRYLRVFWPYIMDSDPEWDTTNMQQAVGNYRITPMRQDVVNFLMLRFMQDYEGERMRSQNAPA